MGIVRLLVFCYCLAVMHLAACDDARDGPNASFLDAVGVYRPPFLAVRGDVCESVASASSQTADAEAQTDADDDVCHDVRDGPNASFLDTVGVCRPPFVAVRGDVRESVASASSQTVDAETPTEASFTDDDVCESVASASSQTADAETHTDANRADDEIPTLPSEEVSKIEDTMCFLTFLGMLVALYWQVHAAETAGEAQGEVPGEGLVEEPGEPQIEEAGPEEGDIDDIALDKPGEDSDSRAWVLERRLKKAEEERKKAEEELALYKEERTELRRSWAELRRSRANVALQSAQAASMKERAEAGGQPKVHRMDENDEEFIPSSGQGCRRSSVRRISVLVDPHNHDECQDVDEDHDDSSNQSEIYAPSREEDADCWSMDWSTLSSGANESASITDDSSLEHQSCLHEQSF